MTNSALDRPVPRELIDQILPEAVLPDTEIRELGEGIRVGSLRQVPPSDVPFHEAALSSRGFRWTTLLDRRRATILYHAEMSTAVSDAIRLETRDMGFEEPPLSLNEHLRLAGHYGVSAEVQEEFKERVLRLCQQQCDVSLQELRESSCLSCQQDTPEVADFDEEDEIQRSYIQYIKTGNSYSPAGEVTLVPTLKEFAYRIDSTPSGPVFTKIKARTDELLRFENSTMDQVVGEIGKFWGLKDDYDKLGFLHNRGILLYGPPGTGKSCLMQQVAEMMIQRGDVVFFARNVHAVESGLKAFREVEPSRKVVVILEDTDEYIQYNERELLQLLDGEDAVDNVLYLASTNYIERFPPRLLRPGRFDKHVFLGPPPVEGRRVYLKHKLSNVATAEEIDAIVEKTKGLSFGHLRELVIGAFALKEPLDEVIARLRKMGAEDLSDDKCAKRRLRESRFKVTVPLHTWFTGDVLQVPPALDSDSNRLLCKEGEEVFTRMSRTEFDDYVESGVLQKIMDGQPRASGHVTLEGFGCLD